MHENQIFVSSVYMAKVKVQGASENARVTSQTCIGPLLLLEDVLESTALHRQVNHAFEAL